MTKSLKKLLLSFILISSPAFSKRVSANLSIVAGPKISRIAGNRVSNSSFWNNTFIRANLRARVVKGLWLGAAFGYSFNKVPFEREGKEFKINYRTLPIMGVIHYTFTDTIVAPYIAARFGSSYSNFFSSDLEINKNSMFLLEIGAGLEFWNLSFETGYFLERASLKLIISDITESVANYRHFLYFSLGFNLLSF